LGFLIVSSAYAAAVLVAIIVSLALLKTNNRHARFLCSTPGFGFHGSRPVLGFPGSRPGLVSGFYTWFRVSRFYTFWRVSGFYTWFRVSGWVPVHELTCGESRAKDLFGGFDCSRPGFRFHSSRPGFGFEGSTPGFGFQGASQSISPHSAKRG